MSAWILPIPQVYTCIYACMTSYAYIQCILPIACENILILLIYKHSCLNNVHKHKSKFSSSSLPMYLPLSVSITHSCQSCGCNLAGSRSTLCNDVTGECVCKQYVTGLSCDQCRPGFQFLQASNPFGCSAS